VDGYNIIYQWGRLKKHMVRGNIQQARQLLMDDLEGLASLRSWRIECVFDGGGRSNIDPLGGPGKLDIGTNPTMEPFGETGTVRSVYTGRGIEADTYIEGRCMASKNETLGKITSSLIVATDDLQIKLVASGAGALCMSSSRFVFELKAVRKGMQFRVEKAMADATNTLIRHESLWGPQTNGGSDLLPGETRFLTGNGPGVKVKEVLEERKNGAQVIKHTSARGNSLLIIDKRNTVATTNKKKNVTIKKKKKKKKKKK